MARIILVTGGCRSGKSAHAQKLAESLPGAARRAYIATAPVIDEEMRTRVRKHQQARAAAAGGWTTIEAPIELAEAIAAAGMPATEQPSQAWHPARLSHDEIPTPDPWRYTAGASCTVLVRAASRASRQIKTLRRPADNGLIDSARPTMHCRKFMARALSPPPWLSPLLAQS